MSHASRSAFGVSLGFALLLPLVAFAQGSTTREERAILGLEDQFLQSRVTGDASAVEAGFAGDGVFIRENGDEQTKAAYLKDVTKEARWVGVEETERIVHVYGDAAVTHAVIVVNVGAGLMDTVRARTTGIYVKQAGHWRIVSWQSTILSWQSQPAIDAVLLREHVAPQ